MRMPEFLKRAAGPYPSPRVENAVSSVGTALAGPLSGITFTGAAPTAKPMLIHDPIDRIRMFLSNERAGLPEVGRPTDGQIHLSGDHGGIRLFRDEWTTLKDRLDAPVPSAPSVPPDPPATPEAAPAGGGIGEWLSRNRTALGVGGGLAAAGLGAYGLHQLLKSRKKAPAAGGGPVKTAGDLPEGSPMSSAVPKTSGGGGVIPVGKLDAPPKATATGLNLTGVLPAPKGPAVNPSPPVGGNLTGTLPTPKPAAPPAPAATTSPPPAPASPFGGFGAGLGSFNPESLKAFAPQIMQQLGPLAGRIGGLPALMALMDHVGAGGKNLRTIFGDRIDSALAGVKRQFEPGPAAPPPAPPRMADILPNPTAPAPVAAPAPAPAPSSFGGGAGLNPTPSGPDVDSPLRYQFGGGAGLNPAVEGPDVSPVPAPPPTSGFSGGVLPSGAEHPDWSPASEPEAITELQAGDAPAGDSAATTALKIVGSPVLDRARQAVLNNGGQAALNRVLSAPRMGTTALGHPTLTYGNRLSRMVGGALGKTGPLGVAIQIANGATSDPDELRARQARLYGPQEGDSQVPSAEKYLERAKDVVLDPGRATFGTAQTLADASDTYDRASLSSVEAAARSRAFDEHRLAQLTEQAKSGPLTPDEAAVLARLQERVKLQPREAFGDDGTVWGQINSLWGGDKERQQDYQKALERVRSDLARKERLKGAPKPTMEEQVQSAMNPTPLRQAVSSLSAGPQPLQPPTPMSPAEKAQFEAERAKLPPDKQRLLDQLMGREPPAAPINGWGNGPSAGSLLR